MKDEAVIICIIDKTYNAYFIYQRFIVCVLIDSRAIGFLKLFCATWIAQSKHTCALISYLKVSCKISLIDLTHTPNLCMCVRFNLYVLMHLRCIQNISKF